MPLALNPDHECRAIHCALQNPRNWCAAAAVRAGADPLVPEMFCSPHEDLRHSADYNTADIALRSWRRERRHIMYLGVRIRIGKHQNQ